MDQKQYLAMSEIMADCREFAIHMYRKMMEAGIMFKGNYHLTMDIGRRKTGEKIQNATIELASDPLDENWYQDRMEQENISMEGWLIRNDPIAKSGTVPFIICPFSSKVCGKPEGSCEARTADCAAKSDADNPGMWFSNADGDPPMVCGGNLNDSVADG